MAADIGYDNKVAIITGAGGGLGKEHALLLAARGARVVVNDLGGAVDGSGSNKGAAQIVVDEIEAAGGVAVADTNSVATPEGGEAIVQTAVESFGQVDIVVNNAGILRDKSFHNLTNDLLEPVLDVHLKGSFYVTMPAWKLMREQNYGRVIMTSSGSGLLGNFGQANYGAAKAGLYGLTRVLAVEGARNNIKVNAIAPVAKTRMTEDLLGPMGDRLAPEFVAPVVGYLASEECAVSGEAFSVAGGTVSRMFMAVSEGYFDADLTPESMRDNLDQVRTTDRFSVFEKSFDEFAKLTEMMGVVG